MLGPLHVSLMFAPVPNYSGFRSVVKGDVGSGVCRFVSEFVLFNTVYVNSMHCSWSVMHMFLPRCAGTVMFMNVVKLVGQNVCEQYTCMRPTLLITMKGLLGSWTVYGTVPALLQLLLDVSGSAVIHCSVCVLWQMLGCRKWDVRSGPVPASRCGEQ